MPIPDADPIAAEIHKLLRQPMPEAVEDFARIHLSVYREEALKAARLPMMAERERVALVIEARRRLRDKLRGLFAWAKETGRM